MKLNAEQQAAVDHGASTVVLAGPGSGKTDTLVEKVCMLLETEIAAPQAVACLTYGTNAVTEFDRRLRTRGHRRGRHLYLGTVHSFCLNRVVRPYGHLVGQQGLRGRNVLTSTGQLQLRERALNSLGVQEKAQYFDPTLTRIRRDLICGDSVDSYDDRHVEVALEYERLLEEGNWLDFDAMTFEALRILKENPSIADLVACRFPWILVDEYQDMGGVLHQVVLALRLANVNLFVVGDPDQCVYEFTGAKPGTIGSLEDSNDFLSIRLRYNYRNGQKLMDVATVALDETRNYEPDPDRTDLGEVLLHKCAASLESQADMIVDQTIPAMVSRQVPLHEIAILYPSKGPILDAVVAKLDRSNTPYSLERESSFPTDPIVKWLQRCASFAIDPSAPNLETLGELVIPLRSLVVDARAAADQNELQTKTALLTALSGPVVGEENLGPWLSWLVRELDVMRLLQDADRAEEHLNLEGLLGTLDEFADSPTVVDFATSAVIGDKVLVTTYHSSKGRQFDVVLLPGLQNTLMPRSRWNYQRNCHEVTDLASQRRLFYVALTRARHTVALYYSDGFTNRYGRWVDGYSMFIDEIAREIGISP